MFKIFSIGDGGSITEGIEVVPFTLKRVNVTVPVFRVGDGEGPMDVLPLKLTPELQKEFDEKGTVRVLFGEVVDTPVAKVLQAGASADSDEKAIVSLHARGITSYSGDAQPRSAADSPKAAASGDSSSPKYHLFPFEQIRRADSRGNDIMRMFFTAQKGVVFRFGKGGKQFDPSDLFYRWDGTVLLGLTREERAITAYF